MVRTHATLASVASASLVRARRLALVVSCLALVVSGAAFRWFDAAVGAVLSAPIRFDPPLSSLPQVIGEWHGEDVSLSDGVLRIAGNDDYVSRVYRNVVTGESVSLYIGYTAHPRTMLRHRPDVCYPSAGWSPAGVTTTVLTLSAAAVDSHTPASAAESGVASTDTGRRVATGLTGLASGARPARLDVTTLPVRIHEFLRPGIHTERVAVLHYYVLAGVPTVDDRSFWSLGWRTPNLARDASRYVAQVQLVALLGAGDDAEASGARRLLERFAAETACEILRLLPAPTSAGSR